MSIKTSPDLFMTPVSPVFNTVVTVSIGLKNMSVTIVPLNTLDYYKLLSFTWPLGIIIKIRTHMLFLIVNKIR